MPVDQDWIMDMAFSELDKLKYKPGSLQTATATASLTYTPPKSTEELLALIEEGVGKIGPIPTQLRVIKSPYLEPGTIFCSEDVYEALMDQTKGTKA